MAIVSSYYHQVSSFIALAVSLSLLIILMTLWKHDFWRDAHELWAKRFRSQFKRARRLDFYFTAISDEKGMIELIPQLPQSDEPPSFVDMAQLLVKALPVNERSEAYTLLVTQLLPKKLPASRNLERWEFDVIYHDIILLFREHPSYERLTILKQELFENEIKELIRNSLALAMARYLLEYPEATHRVLKRHRKRVNEWLAMSISEVEHKALELSESLERWEKLAPEYPDLWEEYKLKSFNAQLNLNSAYSGSFHAAMGDFAIFLDAVGASFEELQVH